MRTICMFLMLFLCWACGRQSPASSATPSDAPVEMDTEVGSALDGMDLEEDEPPTRQIEESHTNPTMGDFTIHPGLGFGAISKQASEDQLIITFGKEQVSQKDFYIGEGYSEPGLVVFSGTPQEVEVLLDANGDPSIARVSREDSRWQTDEGIRIGSTLRELEQANGRPFTFYGLDWDYGGTVSDWQGGNFPEGFGVRLGWGDQTFDDPDGMPIGDSIFSSENFPHLDLQVVMITQQL